MTSIARTPEQLGAIIRRQRKLQQLTQTEVSAKTHLRQATISALENGEHGVQLKTLTDILAALSLELVVRPRSTDSTSIEDLF